MATRDRLESSTIGRRWNTMAGLWLAIALVSAFWLALGVGLWMWLR